VTVPARPWERRQQQQQQQQSAQQLHQPGRSTTQQLLQQAVDTVSLQLHTTALQARSSPDGTAAAALAKLFVPSVTFLSAAVSAARGEHSSTNALHAPLMKAGRERPIAPPLQHAAAVCVLSSAGDVTLTVEDLDYTCSAAVSKLCALACWQYLKR